MVQNVATKDPVRVGVLFSETGVTSTIGRSQLQGTLLAIDEVNEAGGLNGRELVPVYYDARSTPAVYAQLAERLITQDRVNVIFGCYMSSSRKAVIPVIEKWNKLLFYPTLYEGFEFSSNLIYTGAAPNQNSVQLAEFMTSNFGARVYLIGSDYIYPYESNRIMGELVCQRQGGESSVNATSRCTLPRPTSPRSWRTSGRSSRISSFRQWSATRRHCCTAPMPRPDSTRRRCRSPA